MESHDVIQWIEFIARGIEVFGVLVIASAFTHAIIRSLIHFRQNKEDWFERLKTYIGKSLQLALEFLVAADIIRTVTIEPTREGMITLGLLILVRTVLSWSITVEVEGCWPWQMAKIKKG